MNRKAIEKLEALIKEIEEEGSFLNEHSCIFILDDLRELLRMLNSENQR